MSYTPEPPHDGATTRLSTRADFDQDAARITRQALIERHADAGTVVPPQHFATRSSGTIARAGNAFRFDVIEGS